MKPKELKMPEIADMKKLTAAELNNIRFSTKHTLLSPQFLDNLDPDSPPETSETTQM